MNRQESRPAFHPTNCIKFEVNPWNYFQIQEEIKSRLKKILEYANENNLNPAIGLNYTGGTKAMSVHTYQAVKESVNNVKFSYLDANAKYMRFDETTVGAGQHWIDISDVNSKAFEMTKISLDQLLALHGWEKMTRSTDNPLTDIRFNKDDLTLAKLEEFNGDKFEDYIFSIVQSLKDRCKLGEIGTNFEVSIPNETDTSFFELDVFAIRGYQLFAISCTLEGRSNSTGKKLRKAKLFEVVHRAKQLGGAEARISLVSLADDDRNELLQKQLKNDRIEVWGKADLRNLQRKLEDWFNGE